jgi:hypothetical protein
MTMESTLWQKNMEAFSLVCSNTEENLQHVYEHEAYHIRDTVILVLSTKLLVFKANADDDTVSVICDSARRFKGGAGFQESRSPVWKKLVGKQLVWGWVTIDQQGYCDGILLSFDEISPQVHLDVAGSSIRINSIVTEADLASRGRRSPVRKAPNKKAAKR